MTETIALDGAAVRSAAKRAGPLRRRRIPVQGALPVVALGLIWQVAGNPDSPYFPPPSEWWNALDRLSSEGVLWGAISNTMTGLAVALVFATMLGAVIGTATGLSSKMDTALGPTLEFLRTMPVAALVPIGVLLIGYNDQMKVSLVAFGSMWPILLSTRAAARTANPLLNDVARTLRLSRLERILKITLPQLVPGVLLGLRVAAPMCLIGVLVVELLTGVGGIGTLLADAQNHFDSGEVYGLVAVTAVLAVLINAVISTGNLITNRYRSNTGSTASRR